MRTASKVTGAVCLRVLHCLACWRAAGAADVRSQTHKDVRMAAITMMQDVHE